MGRRGQGNEPWYRSGLQFTCTGCGNCCSGAPGYVWVTEPEVVQLANASDMSVDMFRDKFLRRVGDRESLIEYSDGDCIFLDPSSRQCLVYEARPTQCRTWPFWESNVRSPVSWEKTCEACPGAGQGKLYTLQQIEMARQRSLSVDDGL